MKMEARVQSLAQSGVSNVPPQYIQPPEHRPIPAAAASGTSTVPLIDFSGGGDVRAEIGRACREWGAFQAINHGVPIRLLDEIRGAGSAFFEGSDAAEKLKYSCDPSAAATEGYGTRMLVSQTDDSVLDWRDYFDHHTFPLSRRNPSRWPDFPPNYRCIFGGYGCSLYVPLNLHEANMYPEVWLLQRRIVEEYSDQMKVFACKLLALISESLGAQSSCIEEAVGEFYQNITISYYPPCPQPELTLGLQSHSDMGAITLLIQDDVGGLEVLKDGEWVTVKPLSDAIVVLLADQTEVITNGAYKSGVHRAVTNASRARLSVATFHDPSKTRKVVPAPEIVRKFGPQHYREVVYGDYVTSWYTKGPEGKRNIDALLL